MATLLNFIYFQYCICYSHKNTGGKRGREEEREEGEEEKRMGGGEKEERGTEKKGR